MKKLSTIMMCLFAMMAASLSANAQDVTITLRPGCTWISYPNAETMNVATALGGFVPMEGDVIKSQFSQTVYSNGRWRGSLQQFTPGLGYMYYSNRTEAVSFVFGAESSGPDPSTVPTGAINGKFTINADGDQVYFSQGNLQYRASTNTWRFAENQWEYVGSANTNISSTYSGWIDLFGWATSGYHNPNDALNINYEPWSTSVATLNTTYNYYGYGPSTNLGALDLIDSSANYDWGVYNAISNGGNQVNSGWRTLTDAEWRYVINTRNTLWGIRYAKAKINDINGVILLPDDWSPAVYMLYSTDIANVSYNVNMISIDDWVNVLEPHGAIFLPAACNRTASNSNPDCANYINPYLINYEGHYWSSTHYNSGTYNSQNSWCLIFRSETTLSNFIGVSSDMRRTGCSVRLVRDVQ